MKKFLSVLKIILIAACATLSLSFLITMSRGIINHGNVIGIVICLAVIFLLLLYDKFKKNKPFRIIARIAAGFFAASAVYSVVVSAFMLSAMLNTPQRAVQAGIISADEPETVIVLGCKTLNGTPSLMLKNRLDAALDYLNQNPAAVCVVTGGQGADEVEPEAVTMRRYLIANGIDGGRIYTEEKSRNTEQNIMYTKEIIDEHNLPKNVVVVSEPYHVYRGMRNAEKLGLTPSAICADVSNTFWAMPSYWLREIFAISRDYVFEIV